MAGERDLPGGLGMQAFWTLGSNGYKDDMDTNFLNMSVLVQPYVLSSVATLPGTPTDGDIHRMTGGANDLDLAVRDNGAWVYLTPYEGFLVYDRTADEYLTFNGVAWASLIVGGSSQPYDVRTAFTATPGDGEEIDAMFLAREVTFPADFAGSVGGVGTNPTAGYVVTVKDDGTTIGTITVATGGGLTFATVGGTAQVVAVGSRLSFESQATADASVENGTFTLLGGV
jgi:hypothetical protein